MIKDTLGKAARALRATVFALGVAVMLAAVLGVATTANAAVGDPLKLGRLNTVNKLTQLVGSVDGAMLRIDNNNAGEGATALDLQVEAGKAPMKVNPEAGTVTNLSADELDGKDSRAFLPTTTYIRDEVTEGDGGANRISGAELSCFEGDVLLGGGVTGMDAGTRFIASFPSNDARTWIVSWANDGTVDSNLVRVYCADLWPLRPDERLEGRSAWEPGPNRRRARRDGEETMMERNTNILPMRKGLALVWVGSGEGEAPEARKEMSTASDT